LQLPAVFDAHLLDKRLQFIGGKQFVRQFFFKHAGEEYVFQEIHYGISDNLVRQRLRGVFDEKQLRIP